MFFSPLYNIKLITISHYGDFRGDLHVIESIKANRFFWILGNGKVRGDHAHKKCTQIVFAISGDAELIISDIRGVPATYYATTEEAIFIPPMLWVKITPSRKSIIGVLAGRPYEESDYIKDPKKFFINP
jgi:UDP-2-acetamido-3-amino-2,3-dideoxy-glucuronate N-acetyltransferase